MSILHKFAITSWLTLLLMLPDVSEAQTLSKVCEVRPGCGVLVRETTSCRSDAKWHGQCMNGLAEGKGILHISGIGSLEFVTMQGGREVGIAIRRAPALADGVFVGRRTPGEPFVSTRCDATGSSRDGSEIGGRLCAEAVSEWGRAAFSENYSQNVDQLITGSLSSAGIRDSSAQSPPRAAEASGLAQQAGASAQGVVQYKAPSGQAPATARNKQSLRTGCQPDPIMLSELESLELKYPDRNWSIGHQRKSIEAYARGLSQSVLETRQNPSSISLDIAYKRTADGLESLANIQSKSGREIVSMQYGRISLNLIECSLGMPITKF